MGTNCVVNTIEIEAEKCREEAEDSAPRIAHEEFCRRKIENEKTQASAEQGPGNCRAHRRAAGGIQSDISHAGDGDDSRRQPIGAVKKVESIYENHHEDARGNSIEQLILKDREPPLRLGHERARNQLDHQPEPGRQSNQVIHEACDPHQQQREKNQERRREEARASRGNANDKRATHCDAAQAGGRSGMRFQVAGQILQLPAVGESQNQRQE